MRVGVFARERQRPTKHRASAPPRAKERERTQKKTKNTGHGLQPFFCNQNHRPTTMPATRASPRRHTGPRFDPRLPSPKTVSGRVQSKLVGVVADVPPPAGISILWEQVLGFGGPELVLACHLTEILDEMYDRRAIEELREDGCHPEILQALFCAIPGHRLLLDTRLKRMLHILSRHPLQHPLRVGKDKDSAVPVFPGHVPDSIKAIWQ